MIIIKTVGIVCCIESFFNIFFFIFLFYFCGRIFSIKVIPKGSRYHYHKDEKGHKQYTKIPLYEPRNSQSSGLGTPSPLKSSRSQFSALVDFKKVRV